MDGWIGVSDVSRQPSHPVITIDIIIFAHHHMRRHCDKQ
jgi:hypothetical protein